jgi:5-methylcytosine-specific restriction endonuclease McrBC GTP-binding regulatory subunit McrB
VLSGAENEAVAIKRKVIREIIQLNKNVQIVNVEILKGVNFASKMTIQHVYLKVYVYVLCGAIHC